MPNAIDWFGGKPAPPFEMHDDENVTLNAVDAFTALNNAKKASESAICHQCGNNLVKTGGYIGDKTVCWDCADHLAGAEHLAGYEVSQDPSKGAMPLCDTCCHYD